jgi:hypothetical protein
MREKRKENGGKGRAGEGRGRTIRTSLFLALVQIAVFSENSMNLPSRIKVAR